MNLALIVYLALTFSAIQVVAAVIGIASLVVLVGIAIPYVSSYEPDDDEVARMKALATKIAKYFMAPALLIAIIIPGRQEMIWIGGAYAVDKGYEGIKNLEIVQRSSPKLAQLIELQLDQMIAGMQKEKK